MKRAILVVFSMFCLLSTLLVYAAQTIRMDITGVEGDILKNIQRRLDVQQQSYGPVLTAEKIQDFYKNAPENIQKAVEPYGYFKARTTTKLTQHGATWLASFHINLGPALKIKKITVKIIGSGKHNPAIQKWINHLPITAGQVFNTEKYEATKESLFQVINNEGYLKPFYAKKSVRINLQKNNAEIILIINTGPRYYFGRFTFNENPYASEFLQRFIPIKEGEPFSSEKLLKLQQDLSGSRYFKQAAVNPDINAAQNYKVPTQIDITAPHAEAYKAGIGYGTFTDLRLTLGTEFRRLTDTGQHFSALIKYSSVLKGLAAKYYIPGDNPMTDEYALGANIQKFIPRNASSTSQTYSASYVKNIHDWQNTTSLSFISERYKANDQPSRTSRLLYPSYNIAHTQADNMLDPTKGHAFSFNIQGSSENVLSLTSFIQFELKAKYIFSPTTDSRFITRGNLGYTVVNDLNQLPMSLTFFAGGPSSIRGYPPYGIGGGRGRYLKVGSVEYQHQIIGNWSGALFYDIGTAGNHINDPLYRGDGVGVIYTSPVGPIKLYVARAETTPGKPLRVEFSIGPDF